MMNALEAHGIIKDFTGVRALNNITFTLEEGQIHALCGENGAGKSTLINVLSGVYPISTYEGEFSVFGKTAAFKNSADAIEAGIGVVHQELSLFPELSVMENLFVGHEAINHGMIDSYKMYTEAAKWLERLGIDDVNPLMRLRDLGVGKQQLIEIARILRLNDVKILILDEPTASLTESETGVLLNILGELKAGGMSIIYISHKLDEVMRIADYVSVIRDGESIGGAPISEIKEEDIVRMMVGRELVDMYPVKKRNISDTIMAVKNFSVEEHFTGKEIVLDVSFELKKGEVLGLFGLIGAGRTELVSSIFGSKKFVSSGEVFLEGEKVQIRNPHDAINKGMFYCTEDRKELGIISTMSIRENTTIANLDMFKKNITIDVYEETKKTNEKVKAFKTKTPSLETKIVNLSGGNQQKVLLGRSMLGNTKVLILDEPTRGIDVGAKQEIYSIINDLVAKGLSLIVVSSELPEILGICDRVIVMHRGKMTGELDNMERKLTEENVMAKATGL